MKSDIMNVDKLVSINKLKEVTSPLAFTQKGIPDPDGLYSYTIFGLPGSKERRTRKAHISLGGKYLHPQVYKILSASDKFLFGIAMGTEYAVWNEKTRYFDKADEDTPKADTGLDFLYKHWIKIKFRRTESKKNNDRMDLLQLLSINEAFTDKWIVIPAFYRDISISSSGQSTNEINKMYQKIIRYTAMIKDDNAKSFTYQSTRNAIQTTLVEIYDHFLNLIRLKNGFFHSAVMGKNIDYGIRTVITAATYTANRWDEMPADYYHSSTPMTQVIAGMTEHIVSWISDWVVAMTGNRTGLLVYNPKTRKVEAKELAANWKDDYSREKIIRKINLFVSSPETRFYPVTIKFADGSYAPFLFLGKGHDLKFSDVGDVKGENINDIRYFTWTDLFYIAAEDVSREAAIMCTRYPIDNPHNEYFSKIRLRSTWKTCTMVIDDKVYDKYPIVNLSLNSEQIESEFVDSYEIFSTYLGPMDADHDGDQTTNRILYSKEATDWVNDYIKSPLNYFKYNGTSDRRNGDVAQHTIYNIMRDPDVA